MTKKYTIFICVIFLLISILIISFFAQKTSETKAPNNSVTLTLDEHTGSVIWNDLIKITVGQQDGPTEHVSIRNHSEITNKESIDLPIGQAILIRFLHGGSAVYPTPDKVFYMIYIQKPVKEKSEELIRTYYIEGEVIGDSEIEAKEELIKLAHAWKVE
ncbi:hypothetical protein M4D81_10255 [Paenibacillus sp. p3-SID867]|uniref:hypothetical protein n=1 Tax=Paenibacillus sp. p3-SID867 TaxID=2916363 RepID=UPI0021A3EA62|nr:hypothetical protein [Paenibacillus sp. p3-SID867]MCT1399402.1 hypothetical protein [Paenibacillus sp. p3-SID867]